MLSLFVASAAACDRDDPESGAPSRSGTTVTSTSIGPRSTSSDTSAADETDEGTSTSVVTTTTAEVTSTTRPTGRGKSFPDDPPPPGEVAPSPQQAQTATELRSQPRCDRDEPTVGLADLFWRPAEARGEQRMAMTTRKDGFETGAYRVTGPLDPEASAYTVRDMQPGGNYYWRILTRHGNEWAHSQTDRFTGPTCVSY